MLDSKATPALTRRSSSPCKKQQCGFRISQGESEIASLRLLLEEKDRAIQAKSAELLTVQNALAESQEQLADLANELELSQRCVRRLQQTQSQSQSQESVKEASHPIQVNGSQY